MATRFLYIVPTKLDGELYSDISHNGGEAPTASNLSERKYIEYDELEDTYSSFHNNSDCILDWSLDFTPQEFEFTISSVNDSVGSDGSYNYLRLDNDFITEIARTFSSAHCKGEVDINLKYEELTAQFETTIGTFSPDSYDVIPLFEHYYNIVESGLTGYNVNELDSIIALLDSLELDVDYVTNESLSCSDDLDVLTYDMSLLIPSFEEMLNAHVNIFNDEKSLNGESNCYLDGTLVEIEGYDYHHKVISSHILNLGDSTDILYHLESQYDGFSDLPRFYIIGSMIKGIYNG